MLYTTTSDRTGCCGHVHQTAAEAHECIRREAIGPRGTTGRHVVGVMVDAPAQTDLLAMLVGYEPAPAAMPRDERHGPAERLFDAPKTIVGQMTL